VHPQQLSKNLPDVAVRQLSQIAQRFTRARTTLKLFADSLPFRIALRTKYC
jgi:hypothetical protein